MGKIISNSKIQLIRDMKANSTSIEKTWLRTKIISWNFVIEYMVIIRILPLDVQRNL